MPLIPLKTSAERLFQRRPHRLERRRIARGLDPRQPVAGIRGEQPGQIPGFGQPRPMRQRPAQILSQPRADLAGKSVRCLQPALELRRVCGQPERLQLHRAAIRVLPHQHEVARIGHQNEAIAVPIAAHLSAHRRQPGVITRGLHLDHAAFGHLPRARPTLLHLLRRIEPKVGMPRPLIGQLADAEHPGLEHPADGIQQIGQRPIARPLSGSSAGGADSLQVGEVILNRCCQSCRRFGHDSSCPL